LSGRQPNENPAEEEKDIEDAVKELAESFHFGDAEVREMRESLKQSMATGQDAAQESGLEDYLKKCGLDNLGEYPKFCLHLGTLIEMSGSSPVKEALKGEFGYSLMEFAEKNSTIAPELEDYIVKTMVLGKKKRETN
jgi:hypothetical protein